MKIEQLENVIIDKGSERLIDKKLVDFLPNIKKSCPGDRAILLHWKRYFDGLKVPYVVQETEKTFILWKKQEAVAASKS